MIDSIQLFTRHEQYYCLAIDIDIFANDWYCHWYWKNFFRKIDIAIEIDKAVSKTIDIAIEIEKSQLLLIDKQLVLTLPSITIGIDIAIDFCILKQLVLLLPLTLN